MRDDLVQQLTDVIWAKHPMSRWGAEQLARAVLASGLVVPKVMLDVVEAERADYIEQLNRLTSDVLNLAEQWESGPWCSPMAAKCAAELRALTQQEPR